MSETGTTCTHLLPSPTGQHLPVDQGNGEDVDLVVVLGVRVPQLWGLPVDSSDQTPDHRPSTVLDAGQPKVSYFSNPMSIDKNVCRFALV